MDFSELQKLLSSPKVVSRLLKHFTSTLPLPLFPKESLYALLGAQRMPNKGDRYQAIKMILEDENFVPKEQCRSIDFFFNTVLIQLIIDTVDGDENRKKVATILSSYLCKIVLILPSYMEKDSEVEVGKQLLLTLMMNPKETIPSVPYRPIPPPRPKSKVKPSASLNLDAVINLANNFFGVTKNKTESNESTENETKEGTETDKIEGTETDKNEKEFRDGPFFEAGFGGSLEGGEDDFLDTSFDDSMLKL
eukprot:g5538.t1